jgi:hypothetical protein
MVVEHRPAGRGELEQLGPLVVRVGPVEAQAIGDYEVGDALHALAGWAQTPGHLGDGRGRVPALVEDQPAGQGLPCEPVAGRSAHSRQASGAFWPGLARPSGPASGAGP